MDVVKYNNYHQDSTPSALEEVSSVNSECVKKRKETEEQKIEEKSPKNQTALGGGAYKQCKLPRFPFLGL